MFTGIVEEIGFIKKLPRLRAKQPLVVETTLDGIKAGDSICVQGICLTAVSVKQEKFSARFDNSKPVFSVEFTLSEETFLRTTFGTGFFFREGSPVNLERALQIGSRVGGHFVSGHIDTVGKISIVRRANDSIVIAVKVPSLRYIVHKGSVAIDGVSLTVSDLDKKKNFFCAALVPHTVKNTTFKILKSNQPVNVEYDLMAKYSHESTLPTENGRKDNGAMDTYKSSFVTKEKLKNAGFKF